MGKLSNVCLSLGLLLTVAFLLSAASASNIPEDDPNEMFRGRSRAVPRYRLPQSVLTPSKYKLVIWPILDEDPAVGQRFTAPGEVWIDFDVNEEAAPNITLNTVWINVTSYSLVQVLPTGNVNVPITRTSADLEKEFFIIYPTSSLIAKEKYQLYLKYVAPITAPDVLMAGLYRTSYFDDEKNVTRWLAVTDFESVDARRMVPCFDEPDLKAKWEISVVRQKPYHSLSNFNLKDTVAVPNRENWLQDNYEITELMPTYLVGITVSDYESHTAAASLYPKPTKIWFPPNFKNLPGTNYAADLSAALLAKFEEKLNKSYTFPKMDSVGLNDFSAGAMENWGMNTYRMVRLVYIEGESTYDEKFRMTNTISHELAHQWYGNLITMKWWNDIWLNEGFATYMSYVAVDMVRPEMQQADWILVDAVQYAFQADVRESTHPLHMVNLTTPQETRSGFTSITYDKGASILRMINQFLTETVFYEGLGEYFKNHEYGNAEKDDLTRALATPLGAADKLPTGVSMSQVLDTWTTQTGFPLIHADFDNATKSVVLRQEIFLADVGSGTPVDTLWYVPIAWQKKGEDEATVRNRIFWINHTANSVPLTLLGPIGDDDFVVINPEQRGYYRVKYDNELFERIMTEFNQLASTTQSMIVDDYLNLGLSGYQPLNESLKILPKLKDVRAYLPWYSLFTNLAVPNRMILRTGAYYYYSRYMRDLLDKALNDLGVKFETGDESQVMDKIFLRNRLVEWGCNLKMPVCVNAAKDAVASWRVNNTRPYNDQPDLRPYAYCTAVAEAGSEIEAIYKFILNQYKVAKYDTDQANLLRALACSTVPSYLTDILELALDTADPQIRTPHRLVAMQAVASNPAGLSIARDFVTKNVATMVERLGASAVSGVVSTICSYLYTTAEERWVLNFMEQNNQTLSSVMGSLRSSLTTVRNNIEWHTKYYSDFRAYFLNPDPL